jgi:hypothetical protein
MLAALRLLSVVCSALAIITPSVAADTVNGKDIAKRWCASCHLVENGQTSALIGGEVGLRKCDDAVVVRFRAAHHALAPPIQGHRLRWLSVGPVETVEGPEARSK